MRMCRLTCCLAVVLVGFVNTPPLRAAVEPLASEWFVLADVDDYPGFAEGVPTPGNCVAEGKCTCISDWITETPSGNRYIGNTYRIAQTRRLAEFEIGLKFVGPADLCFSIHRKSVDDAGTEFERIWVGGSAQVVGAGPPKFYSSGPFDGDTNPEITLAAGYIYALAVYWHTTGTVTAAFENNYAGDFGEYAFEGYVLSNAPNYPGGCPGATVDPTGSNALAFSARVCLKLEPGACCRVDPVSGGPECVDLLETECSGTGSSFHGEGTTCAENLCDFGACCSDCGTCQDDYTPEACYGEGNLSHTVGTTCAALAAAGMCGAITGACCEGDPAAMCTEKCAAECASDGGLYRGNGTTCEPNLCIGACCVTGGCVDLTTDTCDTFGGTYREDGTTCATLSQEQECGGACCVGFFGTNLTDCWIVPDRQSCTTAFPLMVYQGDGANCPNPPDPDPDPGEPDDGLGCGNLPDPDYPDLYTGPYTACCLPDGMCINTPPGFCTAGWVQGASHPSGTQCSDVGVTCDVGPCCFSDGDCQLIMEHACLGRGGTPTPGELCESDTCLQPTGACCSADAQCTSSSEAACLASGGEYQGDAVPCPPVPSDLCPGLGACCLSDGTCVDWRSEAMCVGVDQGEYQGDNNDCLGRVCTVRLGACCTATGVCLYITEGECGELEGETLFRGEGVTCGEQPTCPLAGACCLGDGCADYTVVACDLEDGIHQGEGTSCAEGGRCDLGACCDTIAVSCTDTRPAEDCTGEGKIFAGVDTTCEGTTCELGRCCMNDGTCKDRLPASYCLTPFGAFEGGRTCDDEGEDCPAAGACCKGISCYEIIQSVCDAGASIYQGDGTSCGEPGRCDLGACCDTLAGTCTDTRPAEDCLGVDEIFAGVDTTCEGGACEPGRCCMNDGTCLDGLIGADCTGRGGTFGLGVICDAPGDACPTAGACCFPDGSCDFATEETCTVSDNNTCSDSDDHCTTDDHCGEGYCIKAIYAGDRIACDSDPGLCRRGACCYHASGDCGKELVASACAGPFEEFHESLNCASISCLVEVACCRGDGTCGDEVWELDCTGPFDTPHPATTCADLDPGCEKIGACCRHLEGVCHEDVVESECTGATDEFFAERDCESAGECDQWGACCEDWACTLKSEADCAQRGGVYLGPGEPCDTDICPDRVGACCSLDAGTCEDLVLDTDCPEDLLFVDDCSSDRTRYEFNAGQDCLDDTVSCLPHGPCCLSADVKYVTQQRCANLGGFYGGHGAECDLSLCELVGACCLPDVGLESCQQRPVQACEFEGGGFLGVGACVYVCSDSGEECDVADGIYDCRKCTVGGNECTSDDECTLGTCRDGTECIPGEENECQNLGLCSDDTPCEVDLGNCGDAGYCDDDSPCSVSGQDCQDASNCVRECRHVPCSRESCGLVEQCGCEPEECVAEACDRGWCCEADGTCSENVVAVQCSGPLFEGAWEGQFHATRTTCPDPPITVPPHNCWARGACCLPDDGGCVTARQDLCASSLGGDYGGDGTTCELADRCVVSACCRATGSCEQMTRQDCEPTGVYISGHPDCDDVVCTRGSCCLMEGTCTVNTVDLACPSEMGDFRAGDSCTEVCRPRGACCQEQGECEDNVVPQDCADVLNTFHFASRCDDVGDTCTTSGACCLGGGVCTVMEYVACNDQGGRYFSHGLPCDPMLCCPDADASGVVWTDPPAGVIDARQPREVGQGTVLQGIDTIEVNGPADANAACWTLCETEVEGSENNIASVVEDPPGTYTIEFERRITPGAVTKITYTSWSGATEETGIFTSLPGDTGADGTSGYAGGLATRDVITLVACCLNQSCTPPFDEYSCDIDHSGAVTGADVLRLIDLLNGSGEFLRMWDGQSAHDDGECP